MIKRFEKTYGRYVLNVNGSDRYAYSHSDSSDLYDLKEWQEYGGYQGSIIMIYDLLTGKVYEPFAKKKNVMYGNPIFVDGYLYFLKADYDEKEVFLYKCLPETLLEVVTTLNISEVNLYNLCICGEKVNIIHQDLNEFKSYYPDKFSFKFEDEHESVFAISDGKVYCETWVEEDWDDENNRAGDNYKFYNMVRVRDFNGNLISEEIGAIHQAMDGTYWIV
ncbi:hypothetical protein SAMN02745111_01117 [Eubacterium uniforme]|uniref:DUF5050 domain-containing protein n=1 Tax=Eubacterium uniforme TaxID=39495 RepID=A0A1T4VKH6_9FIRM|nr:hypothetical protein [Eubacterium uniforme]SKA65484.1 hypothetical protein SAMN02745111_01117 [Eubacterium uniforme]